MGAKDLAEKNLLQYKDVFSDIVNVYLFGGRCYVSAEELSREPSELITKAVSDDKLCQLQMDVPMKCKKDNINFFLCLENQSDKNNVMPVRDMGYQHAKYMEQIKEAKESNRKTGNYPTVRWHIVGGTYRTLISVQNPLRLCRTGICRRLSAG